MAKFLNVSMPFIENQGQAGQGISFYSQTFFGKVGVTEKGEILYFLPLKSEHRTQIPNTRHQRNRPEGKPNWRR
jgi:hypothetical protein